MNSVFIVINDKGRFVAVFKERKTAMDWTSENTSLKHPLYMMEKAFEDSKVGGARQKKMTKS